MAKLISKTYGDALFETAQEEDRMDEFFEEAKAVADVLRTSGEFAQLMNHPKIVKDEKIKIVQETFGSRISEELIRLMTLMVSKGRQSEMLSVLEYFISLVKEDKKIGRADVFTAVALNESQKAHVVKRLLETTKYETFEMEYHVDESLIGGMVIRIGERVIDSSIKTKLYHLTRELRNIQV